MENAMEFMDKLSGNITSGINNCMMGRIESFDAVTMKADVMPMVRVKDKAGEIEDVSMLIEVPVSFLKAGPFIIRPPYKPGDIVLVVFADSDIENALLSGDTSNPNSTRSHSLDDAIVVGSIMPYTTVLPDEHSEDLIIGTDDFKTKIVISETDGIIIQSDKKINMSSEKEIAISSDISVTISGKTKNTKWD